MISQLRIYTINKGQMDSWLAVFKEELVPLMERHGIEISGMWVDRERERFIWVRSFKDEADLKAKEEAFYGSAEWLARVDYVRGHIARRDVVLMTTA